MTDSWHIIQSETGGYSALQMIFDGASSESSLVVKMIDGTQYTLDNESDAVGIGVNTIMLKTYRDGKVFDVLINTNFIASVEVVRDAVVE